MSPRGCTGRVVAEILGRNNAVWPSPGGQYLAAASFNESGVRELPVLVYSENVYPTVHTLRYPTVSVLHAFSCGLPHGAEGWSDAAQCREMQKPSVDGVLAM